jgi:hypothetical protein
MGEEFAFVKIVKITLVEIAMIMRELKLVFISYQRKVLLIHIRSSL